VSTRNYYTRHGDIIIKQPLDVAAKLISM